MHRAGFIVFCAVATLCSSSLVAESRVMGSIGAHASRGLGFENPGLALRLDGQWGRRVLLFASTQIAKQDKIGYGSTMQRDGEAGLKYEFGHGWYAGVGFKGSRLDFNDLGVVRTDTSGFVSGGWGNRDGELEVRVAFPDSGPYGMSTVGLKYSRFYPLGRRSFFFFTPGGDVARFKLAGDTRTAGQVSLLAGLGWR